jgi:hypothetical protein
MFRSTPWVSGARRPARLLSVAGLTLFGSAGTLVLALGIEACGSNRQTSGRRVALETRVELASNATSFTTLRGWDVTLTQAVISTGPFYYFDGAPPLVQLGPVPARPAVLDLLGLHQAFAHPGHYLAGDALGQMLEPWSIDLLAGAADLPTGEGVTGVYRSASFSYTSPPVGPVAAALETHAAIAEGVAEREGASPLRFRATADLADVQRSAANGYVDGCEFEALDVAEGGRVTVLVNPKIWFDLVDFAELEPPVGDALVDFPVDSQPKIAFALGLAQLSAYKFSFSAP